MNNYSPAVVVIAYFHSSVRPSINQVAHILVDCKAIRQYLGRNCQCAGISRDPHYEEAICIYSFSYWKSKTVLGRENQIIPKTGWDNQCKVVHGRGHLHKVMKGQDC